MHGFITNTANYSALTEPYFNVTDTVNGTNVRQSKWVDWNHYVDELLVRAGVAQPSSSTHGFDSGIGMLIDTSRNGWGGSARPDRARAVDRRRHLRQRSAIDRRIHAGNWCNQSGAGLGERPKAAPAAGIDAYVWIKPPGESDGASTPIAERRGQGLRPDVRPDLRRQRAQRQQHDRRAAERAAVGRWFSAQFQQLMENAYPPL